MANNKEHDRLGMHDGDHVCQDLFRHAGNAPGMSHSTSLRGETNDSHWHAIPILPLGRTEITYVASESWR